MNPHIWWYVARASGIVAWALLALSVLWGLLVSTRVLQGRPSPAWLLDSHRFLGGLAVLFTATHIGALVADSYVHFGAAEILVPFASAWKPRPVAFGVVALWVLLAVEVTSLLMRRLPRRVWRAVHYSSLALFALAGVHAMTAGTDARNAVFRDVTIVVSVAAGLLALLRALVPKSPSRATRARADATDLRSAA